MMEIHAVRKENIKSLLGIFIQNGGNRGQFSEMAGIPQSQLSHITAESSFRNVGPKLARRIEVNLKLPEGWLDVLQNVEEFREENGESCKFIYSTIETILKPRNGVLGKRFSLLEWCPSFDIREQNMRSGIETFQEIAVYPEYAKTLFGGRSAEELRFYTAHGDTMYDTIRPGEIVVIDITCDECVADGIYLFEFLGRVDLKRLQRIRGEIHVLSDNPRYKEWVIAEEEIPNLRIMGFVVGTWDMQYKRLG